MHDSLTHRLSTLLHRLSLSLLNSLCRFLASPHRRADRVGVIDTIARIDPREKERAVINPHIGDTDTTDGIVLVVMLVRRSSFSDALR
jgi:hypothetical protein